MAINKWERIGEGLRRNVSSRVIYSNITVKNVQIRKSLQTTDKTVARNRLSKLCHDLGAVLTKLSTVNGHIPTGSPSSTTVSYYAYKPMFDEVDELARCNGLTMSLCVDDMKFSKAKSSESFLFGVYQIVRKYGLKIHKRHLYISYECLTKSITSSQSRSMRKPNPSSVFTVTVFTISGGCKDFHVIFSECKICK